MKPPTLVLGALVMACLVSCGGSRVDARMNSDELRQLAAEMMTAALDVVDQEGLSVPVDYARECTKDDGSPTGYVLVGRIYNARVSSMEAGLRDLRALDAAWRAAGYVPTAAPHWEGTLADIFLRDQASGIDLTAMVNVAGEFHLVVMADCAKPGPTDKASMAATEKPRAAEPGGPPVEDIRKILG